MNRRNNFSVKTGEVFLNKEQNILQQKLVASPPQKDGKFIVDNNKDVLKIQHKDVNIVNRSIYEMDIKNREQQAAQNKGDTNTNNDQRSETNTVQHKQLTQVQLKALRNKSPYTGNSPGYHSTRSPINGGRNDIPGSPHDGGPRDS